MSCQQFEYAFKANDDSYIQNLIRFYPNIPIANLYFNGQEERSYEHKAIGSLQNILNDIQIKQQIPLEHQQIWLKTKKVKASETTWQVFPIFAPQVFYNTRVNDDFYQFDDDANQITKLMLARYYTGAETRVIKSINNLDDAWTLVHLVYKKFKFRSALHFSSIAGIVILSEDKAFLLSYKQRVNSICAMVYPAFDMEQGFSTTSVLKPKLPEELHLAFELWTSRGKKGPVFVENLNNPIPRRLLTNNGSLFSFADENAKKEDNENLESDCVIF